MWAQSTTEEFRERIKPLVNVQHGPQPNERIAGKWFNLHCFLTSIGDQGDECANHLAHVVDEFWGKDIVNHANMHHVQSFLVKQRKS